MLRMRKRCTSTSFEPIDELLDMHGLHRKQVAKDGSSLFRAVAELICLSQSSHEDLKDLTLDFMQSNNYCYQQKVSEPLEDHISKIRNNDKCGNIVELEAMAQIFNVCFEIYDEDNTEPTTIGLASEKKYKLYRNRQTHFDIIYTRKQTSVAGYCQALVYQMLYTNVFKNKDVLSTVDAMLHDNNSGRFRTESTNSNDDIRQDISKIVDQFQEKNMIDNLSSLSLEESCSPKEADAPPFPYRVAKALDPNIYRNSDLDIYNTKRTEARFGRYDRKGLRIGVQVRMKNTYFSHDQLEKAKKNNSDSVDHDFLHGHIQLMSEDQGPVEVYVLELGERLKVPYESLEKYSAPSSDLVSTPDRSTFSDHTFNCDSPYKRRSGYSNRHSFNFSMQGHKERTQNNGNYNCLPEAIETFYNREKNSKHYYNRSPKKYFRNDVTKSGKQKSNFDNSLIRSDEISHVPQMQCNDNAPTNWPFAKESSMIDACPMIYNAGEPISPDMYGCYPSGCYVQMPYADGFYLNYAALQSAEMYGGMTNENFSQTQGWNYFNCLPYGCIPPPYPANFPESTGPSLPIMCNYGNMNQDDQSGLDCSVLFTDYPPPPPLPLPPPQMPPYEEVPVRMQEGHPYCDVTQFEGHPLLLSPQY